MLKVDINVPEADGGPSGEEGRLRDHRNEWAGDQIQF